MLKIIPVAVAIIALLFLSGCSTASKIATLKPEPDDASPLLYDTPASFISLPVNVKINDISNQTNALLNGLIYEDTNIEDDNIEMKIWKEAPISISNENGKLKTILPLKALIKYRIGTKTMGVDMYNTKEFNLNGVVTLLSEVSMSNWKMHSKTAFQSINWNESPTMQVFGKSMPITYLINPAIKLFKSKIETNIDAAIEKSMDFKPNVLSALEKVSAPFLMNEKYQSWLLINPSEMYSTDVKLKNDSFLMDLGMKCSIESRIGVKPDSKFDASKIALKSQEKLPKQINANIAAVSTYADATTIISKNFVGQEFGSGKKKITVQKVALWHKNGKIVVALDALGAVNGTIYLTGIPKYDDKTKEIYFDQMDYALDTKDKLIRTANWLAQGVILKKIEQSCRYSIAPNLEEAKKTMATYMKNYSPMSGVFVNGKIDTLTFSNIQLTNKAIIAFVKINGAVSLTVNGLK